MRKSGSGRRSSRRQAHVMDYEPPDDGPSQRLAPINGSHAFGLKKLSDILDEFIEPYLQADSSLKETEALVGGAALAWNLALLPEGERLAPLERAIAKTLGDATDMDATRAMVQRLIDRKIAEYPSDRRVIDSFNVMPDPPGYYLLVKWAGPVPGAQRITNG